MYNGFLMTDFYKTTHLLQFDERIKDITSYMVPRGSRIKDIDKIVVFGIRNFCENILPEVFQKNFFELPWEIIVSQITNVFTKSVNYDSAAIEKTLEKVKQLYDYGKLPVEIWGLPEGTLCPMGVPILQINSVDGFGWVAQAIESLLSCSLWHPMISATIAREYAKIVKKAYDKTVDNGKWQMGMCDFSMRGQESYQSAIASSAAFLTSFYNSSTVEASDFITQTYGEDSYKDIYCLTSTEHSVMCSDAFLNDMDERETYRRLLIEVYPNTSFVAVCDSYDFWNVVTNILPSLRKEIEAHNGFIGIRHDSASSPVEALCGIKRIFCEQNFDDEEDIKEYIAEEMENLDYGKHIQEEERKIYFSCKNEKYNGVYGVYPQFNRERGAWTNNDYYFFDDYDIYYIRKEMTPEEKGMVEVLYELFGGTVNSKGYKALNPKVKAVYGDSITLPCAQEIYDRLEENSFAANNVSLGVGSFSMQCIEENGVLKPFTRDTFSIAIKATMIDYEDENGMVREKAICKSPKGCDMKKSLKGYCRVYKDKNGGLSVEQYESFLEYQFSSEGEDELEHLYYSNNWNVQEEESFQEIRNRIEEGLND